MICHAVVESSARKHLPKVYKLVKRLRKTVAYLATRDGNYASNVQHTMLELVVYVILNRVVWHMVLAASTYATIRRNGCNRPWTARTRK